MGSKLLGAVFVLLAAAVVLAQNPTVVEPKHYLLQFQNDRVEVVFIHYGPHEKSRIHDHPNGVVVNLTAGHLRFIDQNGKVQEVFGKAGEARWFPPFKHRVENLGDAAYEGIYIGLKNKPDLAASQTGAPMDAETQKAVTEAFAAVLKRN
jgi:quercetin dioxygenase-like cupin family protein